MPKNIVVLSDGTGQEGGKGVALNTNVYTIFNRLEDKTPRQIVFYDPGIGTGWRRVTGNIAGAGISRNVRQAYRFIFDNYEPGDRIFLIGFSRGAATMRSLSGFIHHFGILPRSRPELIKRAYKIYRTRAPWSGRRAKRTIARKGLTEVDSLARALYYGDFDVDRHLIRHNRDWHGGRLEEEPFDHHLEEEEFPDHRADHDRYELAAKTKKRFHTYARNLIDVAKYDASATDSKRKAKGFIRAFKLEKKAKAFIAANHTQWCRIEFLGCFDTVAALGLPFPPINAVLNRVPLFQHNFHNFTLSESVSHAYHALAIDDERNVFEPVLWDPIEDDAGDHRCATPGCKETNRQSLEQVWFTGMHTDVGGGYEEQGLAQVTLLWMIIKAHDHGLLLHRRDDDAIIPDPADQMHDSRGNVATRLLYRRQIRRAAWDTKRRGSPTIHEAVLARTGANQIRVWRDGECHVVPGSDYQPWVLDDDIPEVRVDTWPALSRERGGPTRIQVEHLVETQDEKWRQWLALQTEKWPWLQPAPSAERDRGAPAETTVSK